METEYNLNFHEALDVLLNKGAVKGELFVDGIFLKLNGSGQLIVVDACRLYEEESFINLYSLNNQKYRKLTVLTVKELSH